MDLNYSFYGGNAEAFYCTDVEVILSGPADTGKTLALLTRLHIVASKYPGASLVILRKQQVDTYSTVLQTFINKVINECPWVRGYGGEKPQWFDYPNGSRIWVAGLDKAGKVLSAEHDVIYVNQAEELGLPDWETLLSRATGRAGHVAHPQVIGDCNPSAPTHWIRTRAKQGALTFFESTHRDNPELFDPETGAITEAGKQRLGVLKRLTGSRLMRLFHGVWAAPEGAIYDILDEERHKVAAFEPPPLWPRIVGVDPVGAHIAAVWAAWDAENSVLNVYREYMEPFGETTGGHVENILKLSTGETIFAWVGGGPSERQARTDWEGAGIPLLAPTVTDVWAGIDRVYALLKDFNMVIHDSCPMLLSQLGDYRRKLKDGEPTDAIEDKEKYHLPDALRYLVAWLAAPVEGSRVVYDPVRIGGGMW